MEDPFLINLLKHGCPPPRRFTHEMNTRAISKHIFHHSRSTKKAEEKVEKRGLNKGQKLREIAYIS